MVRGDDGISVEITARGQVTPKLSTLDSPARLVVDLPNTVMATSQSHVDVGSDGVKGVRVGMDGQKPPTTRVVVDLEKACRYELVPGGDNKFMLKLYTSHGVAKADDEGRAQGAGSEADAGFGPGRPKPEAAAANAPAAETKTRPRLQASRLLRPLSSSSNLLTSRKTRPLRPAKPTVEPSVTRLEAAAKFADKPASELVPMKPSASLQRRERPRQPAVNLAAEQKSADVADSGRVSGPKYTGEPISVNLKDVDLKDFFRLIHEISGLNVVLDPNVQGS